MPPRLNQLKLSHLRLLARLAERGRIGLAAADIGVSQPTATRLLAEMESLVGQPVHLRSGRGVVLTEAGALLAARAGRMLAELDEGARDLDALVRAAQGQVRVGTVTAPAVELLLSALRTLRVTHPGIATTVTVAPSALLCQELIAGRLDLALGRLTDPMAERDLTLQPIGTEPLSLVVRRGHPLDGVPMVGAEDLLRYDWVMPDGTTPLGAAVLAAFAGRGGPMPRQTLTTSSFLLTLTVVQRTNAIAPLAAAVAEVFAGPSAPLVRLTTDMALDAGVYGLILRRGPPPPAAVRALIARLLSPGAS